MVCLSRNSVALQILVEVETILRASWVRVLVDLASNAGEVLCCRSVELEVVFVKQKGVKSDPNLYSKTGQRSDIHSRIIVNIV
jgi:hypothetical protein